jgi:hypothetical protein
MRRPYSKLLIWYKLFLYYYLSLINPKYSTMRKSIVLFIIIFVFHRMSMQLKMMNMSRR